MRKYSLVAKVKEKAEDTEQENAQPGKEVAAKEIHLERTANP